MKWTFIKFLLLLLEVVASSVDSSSSSTRTQLRRRFLAGEDDESNGDLFLIQLVSNELLGIAGHVCLTFDAGTLFLQLSEECNFSTDRQAWFHDDLNRLRSPHAPDLCVAVDKHHSDLRLFMMDCSISRPTQKWFFANNRFRSEFQKDPPNNFKCLDLCRSCDQGRGIVHLMPCSGASEMDHDQVLERIPFHSDDADFVAQDDEKPPPPPPPPPPQQADPTNDEDSTQGGGTTINTSDGSFTSCERDSDCQEGNSRGACGFDYDNEGAGLICCAAGASTVQFGNEPFCGNRQADQGCGSNQMCASGVCLAQGFCDGTSGNTDNSPPNNSGGGGDDINNDNDTGGDAAAGESCTGNFDCRNGAACARIFGGIRPGLVCCNSRATTIFDTEPYCAAQLANQQPCATDAMCISDFCNPNLGVCQAKNNPEPPPPVPVPVPAPAPEPAAPGEPCGVNNDCENQACGNRFGENGGSICCRTGATTVHGNGVYCANRPNGRACAAPPMCASGYCDTATDTCGPRTRPILAGPGEECQDHANCRNGACGLNYDNDTSRKLCCPSGDVVAVLYDNDKQWYCTDDRPRDAPCLLDTQCASNRCLYKFCS